MKLDNPLAMVIKHNSAHWGKLKAELYSLLVLKPLLKIKAGRGGHQKHPDSRQRQHMPRV